MTFHGGRLELSADDPGLTVSMIFPDGKGETSDGQASRGRAATPGRFSSRCRQTRGRSTPLSSEAAQQAPRILPQPPPRRGCRGWPRCSPKAAPRRDFLGAVFDLSPISCATPPGGGRKCSTGCSTARWKAGSPRITAAIARRAAEPQLYGSRADAAPRRLERRRRISSSRWPTSPARPTTATTVRRLSDLADACGDGGSRFPAARRARPGQARTARSGRSRQRQSGWIVLGMGKLGAHELNFSSDIDLVVFFDPKAPAIADPLDAIELFARLTRRLVRILQDRTERRLCLPHRSQAAARSRSRRRWRSRSRQR